MIQSVLSAATRSVGARTSGTLNATLGVSAIRQEERPWADAPAKAAFAAIVPTTAAERRRGLSRFVADSSVASSYTPDHAHGFHLKPFSSKDEGRRSGREITVFDSTGLAIQDLAIALAAMERSEDLDVPQLAL